MTSIFIIFFILCFIGIIIIGMLFSKISVNILELDIYRRVNKFFIDSIIIEIDFYLFGFIKLFKIKIYKNYFKLFGIKIYLKSISKSDTFKKIFRKIYRKINSDNSIYFYLRKINYKIINLEIKSIDLKVKYGTINPFWNIITVTSISSIFPFIIKKYMKKITDENFKYIIMPNYLHLNNYQINLKICFSFKLYLLVGEILNIMNNSLASEDNNYKIYKKL